jgi:hypothetical protein
VWLGTGIALAPPLLIADKERYSPMTTVMDVPPLPETADPASPVPAPSAPAETPPPAYAWDRFTLLFWLGCFWLLAWQLLADLARGLFRT